MQHILHANKCEKYIKIYLKLKLVLLAVAIGKIFFSCLSPNKRSPPPRLLSLEQVSPSGRFDL